MKKRGIACLLLMVCLCLAACSDDYKLKLNTAEKVVEVYYANEEAFNHAAEVLLGFKEYRAHVSPYQEEMLSGIDVIKEINGVFIEADSLLTDLDYLNLYNAFTPLIESCGFREACTYYSEVEFVLDNSSYGDTAKLYYFQDEDIAAGYMEYTRNDSIMITPHWIAAIERD